MTSAREDFLVYFKDRLLRMEAICVAKNADYSGGDVDPFANFTRVEMLGITSAEVGFLTRMTDKLCRISTFVKKGVLQVKDESVEDTLLDLAIYSLLLAAYVNQKRKTSNVIHS